MNCSPRWMRKSANILRQQIRQIQRELNPTTILSLHDREAKRMLMSDRIFLMNKGEIVQSDTCRKSSTPSPPMSLSRVSAGHYNLVSAHNANSLLGTESQRHCGDPPGIHFMREAGRQCTGNYISPGFRYNP